MKKKGIWRKGIMKRLLILALIFTLSLSLIACGSTAKEELEAEIETQAEETVEPEETPEATQSAEGYTAPTPIPTATPEPIMVVLQSVPLNRMSDGDIEKHAELDAYAREILAIQKIEETAPFTADEEIVELPWIYEPMEADNEKIVQGLGFTVYTFTDIDDQVHYRAWGQKPNYEGVIEAEGFYEISFEETDDGMELVFNGLTAEPVDLEAEKERYPKREGEEDAPDVETQDNSATVPADSGSEAPTPDPAPEAPVSDPAPEPDPAPDTGGDSGKEPGEIDITTGPNGEDMNVYIPDYSDPGYSDPGEW